MRGPRFPLGRARGYTPRVLVFTDPDQRRTVLVPQASHALAAWQIAERWGNRSFARPSPRAEVLAAILLHDGGWTDVDAAPGLDGHGRPHTFDRMPPTAHLEAWRRGVERTALYSCYSALLVAAHVEALAEYKAHDLAQRGEADTEREVRRFQDEMAVKQAEWRQALSFDPRFAPCLDGAGWEVNRRLLSAADAISVHLCAALPGAFSVTACGRSREPVAVSFESRGPRLYSARPWPFEGDRVRVHCQGWPVASPVFASAAELAATLARAALVRLDFTIARPAALGRVG